MSNGNNKKNISNQMTPQELREHISLLKDHVPITSSLEKEMTELGKWDAKTQWYSSQKEHWMGWLKEYDTEGYYGRDTTKKRSAQYSYNHINCPPMLLWLVEASGVEEETVVKAKKIALNCRPVFASQCAAIRKVVPWNLVKKALLLKPKSNVVHLFSKNSS